MAYVAVKGGAKAIEAAHKLLAEERRGDPAVPEITVAQVREQMGLAVDRVMAEGSCYDPDLAALALKQAWGDVGEAIFMLRAYRTTLPRFGVSQPVDTTAMAVRRRVSAAYKDLPGGQILGPTFDYTHRLLDFSLAAEAGATPPAAEIAAAPLEPVVKTIADAMAAEGILQTELPMSDAAPPYDLTRDPPRYPAERDQRLQALARGDEGFLLSLSYSALRGWGGDHPLCGEVRMGEVLVTIDAPEFGFPVDIADITLTECQMIGNVAEEPDRPPYFTRGYGVVFGRSERKAMAMAIVDRALAAGRAADNPRGAADEEFVLAHADHVEASGFVLHLKLPHYVDFQADLHRLRTMRADWFHANGASDAQEEPGVDLAEAAE